MATNNAVNNGLSGATGTVNFVGSTSPTLITPTIGVATGTSLALSNTGILDSNNLVALALSATASAVNGFTLTNAATNTSPILAASGSNTNILATINGKGTGGVAIQGSSNATAPAAGYVGEIINSTVLIGSATSISNATATNLTSITLTPGNWLCFGSLGFTPTGAFTIVQGWMSTTSATLNNAAYRFIYQVTSTNVSVSGICPVQTFSVSVNTTLYLSGQISFSTGSCTQYGTLNAIRLP